MTEIKFWWDTYVGTAEGDHGVFTNSGGAVYAGKITGDAARRRAHEDQRGHDLRRARVGVRTNTSGDTTFVECDADGDPHGRRLECRAGGDTVYTRYEYGSIKESAVLYANGTCEYYDYEARRADYAPRSAPFVALQAMVVPIKARPSTSAPTAALMPHFFAPTAP
jgi:hypothetical protein